MSSPGSFCSHAGPIACTPAYSISMQNTAMATSATTSTARRTPAGKAAVTQLEADMRAVAQRDTRAEHEEPHQQQARGGVDEGDREAEHVARDDLERDHGGEQRRRRRTASTASPSSRRAVGPPPRRTAFAPTAARAFGRPPASASSSSGGGMAAALALWSTAHVIDPVRVNGLVHRPPTRLAKRQSAAGFARGRSCTRRATAASVLAVARAEVEQVAFARRARSPSTSATQVRHDVAKLHAARAQRRRPLREVAHAGVTLERAEHRDCRASRPAVKQSTTASTSP